MSNAHDLNGGFYKKNGGEVTACLGISTIFHN